ncbi:hypothetical protein AB0L82_03690 [Nocardia sp. NPDC052001]|uniref:hypothetical protein n=1 Tax=Nocardia sp. NPDC052001 TaxID=3154853 RepID=UPI00343FD2AA
MPDIVVPLMVIFGFLAAALLLRVLASTEPNRARVRAARPDFPAARVMMDE